MSFVHPIYINNDDVDIDDDIGKKNNFEKPDVDSLDSLIYMNDFIKSIVNKFNPCKWKNKYTNILKLDVFYTVKKDINNDILKNICFDSLYVNKRRIKEGDDIDVRLIYITPHIIFYNYNKGYSTTDIISMNIFENIENICVIPRFNYRSHDNKSIEFISGGDNLLSWNYVTLKSYCDYHCNNNNYKYPLEN